MGMEVAGSGVERGSTVCDVVWCGVVWRGVVWCEGRVGVRVG